VKLLLGTKRKITNAKCLKYIYSISMRSVRRGDVVMKKGILLLFIIVTLLISGCSQPQTVHVDNSLPVDNEKENLAHENEGSTEGDIEEDVNASDLEEDEELTEMAEEEHKTEEDTLVPQEEVEEELQEETEVPVTPQEPVHPQEPVQPQDEYPVIKEFNTQLPEDINLDIKYDKYHTSYDYFLVLGANINIREKPTTGSKVVRKAAVYEKLNLVQAVKGQHLNRYNNDTWYKVFWKNKDEVEYGYAFSALGQPRSFQFDKMKESITALKNEVDNTNTAYVSNYKNRNGIAPLYNGAVEDKHGVKRYQGAPAYIEPKMDSEFRYISDGTLVTIVDKNDKFYKIRTLNFEGEYWVPRKFLTSWHSIKELTKVVVIDRKNQNEGVFEYRDGKWNLISYIFATTGEKAVHKEETSLGYFMAIQTRERFLYLDDETREISGYAPYAIRFNGGAYIHGVPVNFEIKVEGEGEEEKKERIDPGIKEYLYTIGTVPRSHKCVRNYSSHAEFLYNWVEIGKSAVIVIE